MVITGKGKAKPKDTNIKTNKMKDKLNTAPEGASLNSKEVLNASEACQYTGFSKSYLYKLTSRREIPHYKPSGKMVFFNRLELEAWLQTNRVSTAAQIAGEAHRICNNSR